MKRMILISLFGICNFLNSMDNTNDNMPKLDTLKYWNKKINQLTKNTNVFKEMPCGISSITIEATYPKGEKVIRKFTEGNTEIKIEYPN